MAIFMQRSRSAVDMAREYEENPVSFINDQLQMAEEFDCMVGEQPDPAELRALLNEMVVEEEWSV